MKISINQIIRIAALSALAVVATLTTQIHFYGTIIHLGVIIVIISALLLGPFEGGIISGLSMGIYDIFFYNAASAPKTIVSYFLFGLIAGFIASKDTYIKNTILRFAIAIIIGGLIHTTSYFIFNFYILNGGFEYAKVRVISSLISVSVTLFVTIPIALILKPYIAQLKK